MNNEKLTVHLHYIVPKFKIPTNIEINEIEDENFWNHHNNKDFYDKLRKNIFLLPEIINLWYEDKLSNDIILSFTKEQKLIFDNFIYNPVNIEYNESLHKFEIHDGRHRVALGLEKSIDIPIRMSVTLDFERTNSLDKKAEYYAIIQPVSKNQILSDLIQRERAYIIKNRIIQPVSIISSKDISKKTNYTEIYKTYTKLPYFRTNKENDNYDER